MTSIDTLEGELTMIGTFINVATVLVVGTVGVALGSRPPDTCYNMTKYMTI